MARISAYVWIALLSGAASGFAQTLPFSRTDYGAPGAPRAIVAADFNRDGAPDLAMAGTGRDSIGILLNDPAGGHTFTLSHDIVLGGGPFELAAGDLNHDNVLDLAVANADANSIDVLLGKPEGGFEPPVRLAAGGNPRGIAAGDVDGDGRLDLVYTQYDLNSVQVLYGDASGWNFAARSGPVTTGVRPQGIVLADFNRDGWNDVAVAHTGASPVAVLYQVRGDDSFDVVPLAGETYFNVMTVGDFNGDSRVDLAAASTPRSIVAVYLNGGQGLTYSSRLKTGASPRGIEAADIDRDGALDLVTANRSANTVSVMLGRASPAGTFAAASSVPAGSGSRDVALADFNMDGQMDIATANEYASTSTVLTNGTPPATDLYWLAQALPADRSQGSFLALGDFNKNGRVDVVTRGGVTLDGTTVVPLGGADAEIYRRIDAAVEDYDRDGNLDVAILTRYFDGRTNTAELYRGDGAGGFSYAAAFGAFNYPDSISTADINLDGRPDLVVRDIEAGAGKAHVLLGAGGGFSPAMTTGLPPHAGGLEIADMNADGKPDLVVAVNSIGGGVHIGYGDGSGNFPGSEMLPIGDNMSCVKAVDLNADGVLDLVASGWETTSIWLGAPGGTFTFEADYPITAVNFIVADLTGDGRLDVFTPHAYLLPGRGDGALADPQEVNVSWQDAAAVDYDRDGRLDVVLTRWDMLMVILARAERGGNLAPIVEAGGPATVSYAAQFEDEMEFSSGGTYDPNLDSLTYEWTDSSGNVVGIGESLVLPVSDPGTHTFTLTVRDGRGGMAFDTLTVTVTPTKEVVRHVGEYAGYAGAWRQADDPTAAGGVRAWHPNAGAAKLTTALADPANYVDVYFPADPTQEYKLWIRLKAEKDSWANDSVFVQFQEGAVTADGQTRYRAGTTDALDVNLEPCSGCGLSGWGWRDERWGARLNSTPVLLRFARGGWHWMRIQTREDGVSIDQIVLSAETYRASAPGAPKNDTTILPPVPW
jgi:hypothetical protein